MQTAPITRNDFNAVLKLEEADLSALSADRQKKLADKLLAQLTAAASRPAIQGIRPEKQSAALFLYEKALQAALARLGVKPDLGQLALKKLEV